MAVRIRLRRTGRKNAPTFRIVVAESTSPRDGRFIEIIGQYYPRQGDTAVQLDTDRANYWLDVGALPSDTVRSLLRKAGVLKARHEARLARKLNTTAVPVREMTPDTADAAPGGAAE
jgi:small subunit ribosomal protein S16